MRITDIQNCEIRPGRVVEWTLHEDAIAAATVLPDDPRPAAYIQESHLRTARSLHEDGLTVPTWIGVAFDLPGPTDLDLLHATLRAWTCRHETMRSGFRWTGDRMRRFTLDADAVRLDRREAGQFADAAQVARHLQDRFDSAASALTWPNFIYAAVLRDDGASVYLAFDHSNVDAYSVMRIPAEVRDAYVAGRPGSPAETTASASYVDFCTIERTNADRLDEADGLVDRWRDFVARGGGRMPSFPIDLGLPADGTLPRQVLLQETLTDDAGAEAFEQYCRRSGGSLVGVLSATALAVREIGGVEVYRTIVPFHTRTKSQWSASVGWFVGGAPIEIPLSEVTGFDDALGRTRAALAGNRQLSRIPLPRILHLLGADFRPTSPDLYSIVSFVDARGVPEARHWVERKTYGLLRVSYGDQVCVWVTRLPEGLHVACRLPDNEIARHNMRRYLDRLRAYIGSTAFALAAAS